MKQREPRQLNVQQQNARVEQSLREEAAHWRCNDVPESLRKCGEARGVDWARSIVLNLDIDYPGMPEFFGMLLTQDERFIRFACESDGEADLWMDVTGEQNCHGHNKGIGMGWGALAIKVLRDMNALPDVGCR